MIKQIEVTCWGSRGSCPAPFKDRLQFGGNTSCYSIETEDEILILDGGTGLAGLGNALEALCSSKPISIFISHLHLDHICGIPFFSPLYRPGRKILFFGEEHQNGDLKNGLEALISPPYWPVRLADSAADVAYRGLRAGQRLVLPGGFVLETIRANHPGDTLLYSFTAGGRKIVYGLDCEMDRETRERMIPFARGAGLLICDAQYSPEDYQAHAGWGHSTWEDGVRLAEGCQAGQLWLSHFAWEYDDGYLEEMELRAKARFQDCIFVREGMKIQI